MAVSTRYVVVRNNEDVMTFTDKKSADDYDRMLDMADAMTTLIETSKLEIAPEVAEELGIFLASNRDEALYALAAKKRPSETKAKPKAPKKAAKDAAEEA